MSRDVDAVVIGSGALGSSTAFHLAKLGQKVTLVERYGVASQTSPRAAGLTMQIRSEADSTRVAMLAVHKIRRFAEETGEPLVYHASGSVKMARTAAHERQIYAEVAAGQALGLDVAVIDEGDLARLAPWARPAGVRAMWYTASDLYFQPGQLPLGYARGAERLGATVLPHTEVTAIARRDGAVVGVTTSQGPIHAPAVVDAGGAWARLVAEEAGIRVPIQPMRHQLMITEPLPKVADEQPICRVIDVNVYVRPDEGGLMLGGYEPNPEPYDMRRLPPGFQIRDLPLDLGVLRGLAETVRDTFPAFRDAPIREHRGGLPTMTADGRLIVGPVPNLRGFYTATGCCVGGLSTAPAFGQALAELIATGTPSLPLDAFAISRFGPELASDEAIREAGIRSYANQYAVNN